MRHLTDVEFVDLLEGHLAGARAAHAGECAECRAKAETLRDSVAEALNDGGHEPSPLFWDHFSARVADAIRQEPAVEPISWHNWLHNPGSRWAAAASIVVLLMVAAAWRATLQAPPRQTTRVAAADIRLTPDATAPVADDIDADESWAIVRTAADGIAWEDVQEAGISARPGSAERAAAELSAEERAELARLIETELKRSGA